MSHFHPVKLEHASRLINHGPTVLVTSADGTRRDIMAAAWSMPVEFTPPRIAVVIDKSTYTRELAAASGTFGLIVPGAAMIDLAYAVGTCTGREIDKFDAFGIEIVKGPVLGLPLIEKNCAAWMECRLISEPHTEDAYDTCFAEVVSAAADARIFADGHWTVDETNAHLHTIHHLGAGKFVVASAMQLAKPLTP
jgi:flavin reductase (DIM6/NTAB) family NADH-FMN oxidoreductase RutF